ncbi:MAG TPA: cytochrome c peroxidase [bacterium]|nr:cytochrome c peroxidase [bacterium]
MAKQQELYETLRNRDPQAPHLVELPPGSPEFPQNPKNPLTKAGVQLGRWLFYDPIISGDNTMSCSSCHVQSLGFADRKRFSPGIHGQNMGRNTMALANLAWSRNFFWDGRAPSLEAQAVIPIQEPKELDQPMTGLIEELKRHPVYPAMFGLAFGNTEITEERIGRAIGQFVASIVSFEAPLDEIERVDVGLKREDEISPEFLEFRLTKADKITKDTLNLCAKCHRGVDRHGNATGLYGGYRMANNGLEQGQFKAPTLRNIALTPPYMHDGRFDTLEEVLDHYDHGVKDFGGLSPALREANEQPKKLNLSPEAKKKILIYLNLMTDKALLQNKNYSNPFR